MRLVKLLPAALLAGTTAALNSWAGSNSHFLQALEPEVEQVKHIEQLADLGVKVMRLWVNVQPNPAVEGQECVKGSARNQWCSPFEHEPFGGLGKYDWSTLDVLDRTLLNIKDHGKGMKVIISPHNTGSLVGAEDSYEVRYPNNFYSSDDAARDYDNRLKAILEYKGAHTGVVWKDFSELILAFDIQNEPFLNEGGGCTASDYGKNWICKRAASMRSVLGNSAIKVASGGIGGSADNGCSYRPEALACRELDVIALHVYPNAAGGGIDTYINEWKAEADRKGQLMFVEELGINWRRVEGENCNEAAKSKHEWDIAEAFKASTDILNDAGVPWMAWSIVPDPVPECARSYSDDCDETIIPITAKGVNFKEAMDRAASVELIHGGLGLA